MASPSSARYSSSASAADQRRDVGRKPIDHPGIMPDGLRTRLFEGPADQHLGQVGAVLDAGVEVGLGLGVVGRVLGRVRRRWPRRRARRSTAVARIGVEPMFTRPTPELPLFRTAATPTMAQSWARRLNFWNDQPAPGTFGTRISVSSSSGASADSRNPVKKSVAAISRSPRADRATRVPPSASTTAGRSEAGSAWASEPPIVPAVADRRVADLPGRVGEDRHLRPAAGRSARRRGAGSARRSTRGRRRRGCRRGRRAGRRRRAPTAGPAAASSAAAASGRRPGTWPRRRAR